MQRDPEFFQIPKETLNNSVSAEQRIFCPIRAVLKMGNTSSIPAFPKLSSEPKSSAVSSYLIIQSSPNDDIAVSFRSAHLPSPTLPYGPYGWGFRHFRPVRQGIWMPALIILKSGGGRLRRGAALGTMEPEQEKRRKSP